MSVRKVCIQCGKVFEGRKEKKLCSLECRELYKTKSKEKTQEDIESEGISYKESLFRQLDADVKEIKDKELQKLSEINVVPSELVALSTTIDLKKYKKNLEAELESEYNKSYDQMEDVMDSDEVQEYKNTTGYAGSLEEAFDAFYHSGKTLHEMSLETMIALHRKRRGKDQRTQRSLI